LKEGKAFTIMHSCFDNIKLLNVSWSELRNSYLGQVFAIDEDYDGYGVTHETYRVVFKDQQKVGLVKKVITTSKNIDEELVYKTTIDEVIWFEF